MQVAGYEPVAHIGHTPAKQAYLVLLFVTLKTQQTVTLAKSWSLLLLIKTAAACLGLNIA